MLWGDKNKHKLKSGMGSLTFAKPSRKPTRSPSAARQSLRPRAMTSRAFRAPHSRGSRWVPPAPGTSPSFTSGRPYLLILRREANFEQNTRVAAIMGMKSARPLECRRLPNPNE